MLTHPTAAYDEDRYTLLRESESYIETAYVDPKGIPTIGVGFNLRAHLDVVLEKMGFDLTGTDLTGGAYPDFCV